MRHSNPVRMPMKPSEELLCLLIILFLTPSHTAQVVWLNRICGGLEGGVGGCSGGAGGGGGLDGKRGPSL